MPWNDNDNSHKDSPWNTNNSEKNQNNNNQFDELLKNFEKFSNYFKKENNQNRNKKVILIVIAIFCLWLSTGFYKIDEGEQAVILRFGKFSRVNEPGLNFHLPQPIETAYKARVDRVESEDLGSNNLSDKVYTGKIVIKNTNEKSLMLTGDENIVDINFVVQWKISNIEDFMFNVVDPRETVRSAAESAMRDIIGSNPINEPLTEGKSHIELTAKNLVQEILDSYNVGIAVTNLRMARVDPPFEVIDAFRDVQTARSDKEREINDAEAYKNDVVPRARGEASKIIQAAEAYKQQVVSLATGQVSRFNAVYEQYKNSKQTTKQRIYIETMEKVLKDMDKIVINPDSEKNILPYLALPQLSKQN